MAVNDTTLAKRIINGRKELASFEKRKATAEEFLANYDHAVSETTADVEHFTKLAQGRGLSEEKIVELGATVRRAKDDEDAAGTPETENVAASAY